MADTESVEKAVKNLSGGQKFLGRGEIKALPTYYGKTICVKK